MQFRADTDLVHESIMQIPPLVAKMMLEVNKEHTQELINNFVEHVVPQGWGFSYTDKIGAQCRALYDVMADYEIRAALIICVLDVGVGHNRFLRHGHLRIVIGNEERRGRKHCHRGTTRSDFLVLARVGEGAHIARQTTPCDHCGDQSMIWADSRVMTKKSTWTREAHVSVKAHSTNVIVVSCSRIHRNECVPWTPPKSTSDENPRPPRQPYRSPKGDGNSGPRARGRSSSPSLQN